MATLQETFAKRQQESANQINNLYDKQYNANAAGLKAEYDRNLLKATAERDAIAPQFQKKANQLGAGYERQRRNANIGALASGLGSGTAQQKQLGLRNQFLNSYAGLRGEEAEAVNKANQGITDLGTTYQNALVNARNEADIQRDQALIKDRTAQQDWLEKQAATLAKYGNFTGYNDILGAPNTNQMQAAWIAENPLIAYRMGTITAGEYKKLTGKDPNK